MAERKFVAKEGQVDYTNVRYSPVINTVPVFKDKILLVKRSPDMRLYPGVWNGISGFLDDSKDIEEKVIEELQQELGVKKTEVGALKRGQVLLQEAPKYGKTWLVIPMKAELKTDKLKLNWEATEFKWMTLGYAKKLELLPGFREVLDALFG